MAVVSFDPMEYAEQLEAAGMPQAQARVVAKGLTTMFIHNFDELVTKDYLDTRFSEFESRMDLRFVELESRWDLRFAGLESRIESRIAEFARLTDQRFANAERTTDARFTQLESKMDVNFARIHVILGILLAAVAIPAVQTLLIWLI